MLLGELSGEVSLTRESVLLWCGSAVRDDLDVEALKAAMPCPDPDPDLDPEPGPPEPADSEDSSYVLNCEGTGRPRPRMELERISGAPCVNMLSEGPGRPGPGPAPGRASWSALIIWP